MLAGRVQGNGDKEVVRLAPAVNRRTDDPHRYLIAPDDLRRLETDRPCRRARDRRLLSFASGPPRGAVGLRYRACLAVVQLSDRAGGSGRGRDAASWTLDDERPVMRSSHSKRSARCEHVRDCEHPHSPPQLYRRARSRRAHRLHRGRGHRRTARDPRRPQAPPDAGGRPPEELRQPVPERHRHPPPRLHGHAGARGRRAHHRAEHRGRSAGGGDEGGAAQALARGGAPLFPAPAPAGSRAWRASGSSRRPAC